MNETSAAVPGLEVATTTKVTKPRYRIVKVPDRYTAGEFDYVIQRRVLGFFWIEHLKIRSHENSGYPEGKAVRELQNIIDRTKHAKTKPEVVYEV